MTLQEQKKKLINVASNDPTLHSLLHMADIANFLCVIKMTQRLQC